MPDFIDVETGKFGRGFPYSRATPTNTASETAMLFVCNTALSDSETADRAISAGDGRRDGDRL